MAARPPADDVGDPRRAHAWSSSSDNLGAAGLHLTAEETARLDEASDPAPAAYPYGDIGFNQRNRTLPN